MEVALHYPHASGSVAANLQAVSRQKRQPISELLPKYHPELPRPTQAIPQGWDYVFEHYRRLDGRRAAGFTGANPISYQDLRCYCDTYGLTLNEWEVDTVLAIDDARIAQITEEQQRGRTQQ